MTETATNDGRCWHKCNACKHTHYGAADNYRCPRCKCNAPEEEAA